MRYSHELTQEAIQYQSDLLFKELCLAFDGMFKMSSNEFKSSQREQELLLESIINNRFNTNVTISIGDRQFSTRTFDEYHNGILRQQKTRTFLAEQEKFISRFIRQIESGVKSLVDIKTGRLSGLFTELPWTLYIPDFFIDGGGRNSLVKFSVEEVSAVILHEIGHFFTYCEYFSRTVTTNQALSQLSKQLDGSYSVEQREIVIGELKEKLKLNDLDTKALAGSNDKLVIEVAVVTETVIKSRSELDCNVYDDTASEFLADQFAVRFGAGRFVVTALEKIDKHYGIDNAYQSTPVYLLTQMATIALCTAGFFVPVIGTLNAVYSSLFILLFLGTDLVEKHNIIYDTPEARFKRVKQDMVNKLKNRKLSESDKEATLEDIKVVDEILSRVTDKRNVMTIILDTIVPVYRKHRNTMELQKQLESLASSSLYIKAAELSTLN